ncbi:hypothetical protein [Aquamicrobium sp.]|uniref:hypothetical protein n=1 Tax=Aquamicrobium sp. TaxID=1872579 RepID=UPI0025843301|nr:hypothetical protein [Aquamicrobium sp.]MCK9549517.1 hypothetical protein [Aquamicrobium sp.]
MERHGETIKRLYPGLYAGNEVRAERRDDRLWAFEMKCNQLGRFLWFEYSPHGLWTSIGAWRTLDDGLGVAVRLRAGTHFWDADVDVARPYGENIYAALRGDPGL